MRITLIRHPQTIANEKKIIYGKSDFPYTVKGEAQFKYILDYVKKVYLRGNLQNKAQNSLQKSKIQLITSPSIRTRQLAEEIGRILATPVIVDSRISEMNFGIFEGLTLGEAKIKFPEAYDNFQNRFDTTSIPQGESYSDLVARVTDVLSEINALQILDDSNLHDLNIDNANIHESNIQDPKGTIDEMIIVTHGAIIREFLERTLNLGEGSSWKFVVSNGCVLKLDYLGGAYRVKELLANPF